MHALDAVSLLIIGLGAFTIPLLSGRIGIPAAVGEILFGIVVGPHVLGLMHADEYITFLAEFGFAFLMFLVGLELEFGRIEREGIGGLAAASAIASLFFVVAYGVTRLFDLPTFLFLALGAMSVGLLLVTLAETGLNRSPVGQTLIFVGSLGEFLTIVLVTAFSLYYEYGLGRHLAIEMGKLGAILVLAYVVLVVLRTWIWWRPAAFARVVAARDPSEIGVRAAMATMMVFVAVAALMGIEAILGAFVAGALFSFVFREKGILQTKMSSIGFGFFVPIFFIWVGTEFDLSAVRGVDTWTMLGLLLAATMITKALGSAPLLARGFTVRETAGAALMFGAPLTLLVVIARIGLEVGVIDERTSSALVLLAIVTGVICPWLFRMLLGSGRDSH
jgi:Kef-type K+ transport system membrane component KefB